MFHNFPFPIGFLGSVHTASRKATPVILNAQLLFYISIHALLTEGDSCLDIGAGAQLLIQGVEALGVPAE